MVKSLNSINRQLRQLTSHIRQGSPHPPALPPQQAPPPIHYPTTPPHIPTDRCITCVCVRIVRTYNHIGVRYSSLHVCVDTGGYIYCKPIGIRNVVIITKSELSTDAHYSRKCRPGPPRIQKNLIAQCKLHKKGQLPTLRGKRPQKLAVVL